eukprot:1909955-Rhodomonas_salina.1
MMLVKTNLDLGAVRMTVPAAPRKCRSAVTLSALFCATVCALFLPSNFYSCTRPTSFPLFQVSLFTKSPVVETVCSLHVYTDADWNPKPAIARLVNPLAVLRLTLTMSHVSKTPTHWYPYSPLKADSRPRGQA